MGRKKNIENSISFSDIMLFGDQSAEEGADNMRKIDIVSRSHSYSISHHLPTDSNPDDYWTTRLPNNKRIRRNSRKELIESLYEYYTESNTYSFKKMFEAAIKQKQETENVKLETVRKHSYVYEKLVSDELSNTDVRRIDTPTLKKYIQDMVNEYHPKKKMFYEYKGLLNLIFDYCVEHKIIQGTPVTAIHNQSYLKSCDIQPVIPEEKAFSQEEILLIKEEALKRINKNYYINGYAILFSIATGVRRGEIPALKWSDIDYINKKIHIHSQQLYKRENGHIMYYFVPYTKNERGISNNGRYFPLTDELNMLLRRLKKEQEERKIYSEYVFCKEDGSYITTQSYGSALEKICKKLHISITNNHAFRMALNSYVLIPLGIPVTERARMLGHSVQTNLAFYSYAQRDNNEELLTILNTNGVNTSKSYPQIQADPNQGIKNDQPYPSKDLENKGIRLIV